MSLKSGADWSEDGLRFVRGFLENEVPEESAGRLGTWRCVVLLSALLAVLMREVFGSAVSLQDLSAYSERIVEDMERKPRRIVVEAVLRTGSGYERSLEGISEDEILEVLMMVLRWLRRIIVSTSQSNGVLADRVVQLASSGTILAR